jgi:hypothetical protein
MKLTAAKRRHIPKSAFGIPNKHAFPLNDPIHQRLAISGTTRALHAGNISASTAAHIKAEARAKLHHGH